MPVYPKRVALLTPGQNWAGADHPRPFSARFAWVFRFYVASLWVDPECRLGELGNGLDWHLHDRGDQRRTAAKFCTQTSRTCVINGMGYMSIGVIVLLCHCSCLLFYGSCCLN